ncbi:MAG: 50S ribosomal protein L20 [Elusimicrobia bacterium]|nr:50S ribosomal protein L20 [Elusimicrobiota bacterium]MBI2916091.1 50S ribosomal protein L20 [Elusimicrobiota bacterium]MBI3012963.1 50S ribosomal protein L20 [Elusimicrobiota bacterium]MBI4218165.1 50S ribosomal protein L20 [Elusimicrobiota bacterium]
MRVKSGVYTRQRKKKLFRISKGYYSNRNNRWRQALQQVEHSLRYAYRGRKVKKAEYRSLWVTRINAASRPEGLSYSQFMAGLKKANILLNRKMLSELAIHAPSDFQQIASQSKAALQ